jgi:uroporphyrinogen III methyltransferase/synthase
MDARALASAKLCVVGPATAESLLERGIAADVVPKRYVAEGVLDALRGRDDVRGARVLFAKAVDARELLPNELRAMGADVDEVPIYRSVPDGAAAGPLREALARGEVDVVTFTSSSTVKYFVEALGADCARAARAASIGPVTSETARAMGIEVVAEAREATIPGLVEAVVDALVVTPHS